MTFPCVSIQQVYLSLKSWMNVIISMKLSLPLRQHKAFPVLCFLSTHLNLHSPAADPVTSHDNPFWQNVSFSGGRDNFFFQSVVFCSVSGTQEVLSICMFHESGQAQGESDDVLWASGPGNTVQGWLGLRLRPGVLEMLTSLLAWKQPALSPGLASV